MWWFNPIYPHTNTQETRIYYYCFLLTLIYIFSLCVCVNNVQVKLILYIYISLLPLYIWLLSLHKISQKLSLYVTTENLRFLTNPTEEEKNFHFYCRFTFTSWSQKKTAQLENKPKTYSVCFTFFCTSTRHTRLDLYDLLMLDHHQQKSCSG